MKRKLPLRKNNERRKNLFVPVKASPCYNGQKKRPRTALERKVPTREERRTNLCRKRKQDWGLIQDQIRSIKKKLTQSSVKNNKKLETKAEKRFLLWLSLEGEYSTSGTQYTTKQPKNNYLEVRSLSPKQRGRKNYILKLERQGGGGEKSRGCAAEGEPATHQTRQGKAKIEFGE